MQSAMVFQQAINPLLAKVEATADLRLNQIAPLPCHHRSKNNHYNYSAITNSYDIAEILTEYNQRNCKYVTKAKWGKNQ